MSRTVNEWFDNRLDDINTGIDTGREWIGDTASDVGDWFEDRATDVSDWYQDTSTDVGRWYEDTSADVGNWFVDRGRDVRAFGQSVHDNWPRTTQIGAAQLLALGGYGGEFRERWEVSSGSGWFWRKFVEPSSGSGRARVRGRVQDETAGASGDGRIDRWPRSRGRSCSRISGVITRPGRPSVR
jgi:hypothetical protein